MTQPMPVFESSFDAIKAKLRLSRIDEESDGYAVLLDAHRAVRAGFYRVLGFTAVASIQATVLTDNPSSNDEILRLVGASTEVDWMRYELALRMPVLFQDAGAEESPQVWNEEGAFRSPSQIGLTKLRAELWDKIQGNLDLLSGSTSLGNEGSGVSAVVFGPADTPPTPGATAGIVW